MHCDCFFLWNVSKHKSQNPLTTVLVVVFLLCKMTGVVMSNIAQKKKHNTLVKRAIGSYYNSTTNCKPINLFIYTGTVLRDFFVLNSQKPILNP